MATIQSSIKLNDGMTPALSSISKALNIVLTNFESLQRASGKAVNTKSIQSARQELAKAQVQFNNIENEINQNTAAQNRFNNSVHNGSGAVNGLWSKLKSIAGVYLGFQSVKGIVGLSDELTMTTARLDMMNDGLQTTKELQDKIYQSAMRSRGSYLDTADAVAKLGMRAKDIFKNNDETIAFAETLNKMFVIAGASQQEMASATLQLTQALGSGVLRGEEFNAVFESAPNIMQAVADYMKVPIGQLRNMAAEGKISAQIVKNAMFAAAKDVDKQFKKIPYTWSQVWTTIKNYTIKATQPILDQISKITSSQRFIQFANNVGNAIKVLAQILGEVFNMALKVVGVFTDNWSWIGPIVYGVVGAITALKFAQMAFNIVLGFSNVLAAIATFQANLRAAAEARAAGATWAATAAQYGLNTAMYLCPFTWVILGIIAIIASVYGAVSAFNYFAGTSYSATGVIAGAVMWLGSCIYDVLVFVWNCVLSVSDKIMNCFITVGEVVYNAFNGGFTGWISGVKAALWSFVNWAYSIIKPLVKVWDKIKGTNLASELQGTIDGNIEKNKAAAGSTYKKFDRNVLSNKFGADYANPNDMYKKGYKWGSNLGDKVKNLTKGFSTPDLNKLQKQYGGVGSGGVGGSGGSGAGKTGNGLNDIGKALSGGSGKNPTLDKIAKNTGDIANNTTGLSDSQEDLTYMRDLAEQQAINRYTMTDLKIEMNNNNNINSNMDLDTVVNYLQEKVYEGVLATAEGVHF